MTLTPGRRTVLSGLAVVLAFGAASEAQSNAATGNADQFWLSIFAGHLDKLHEPPIGGWQQAAFAVRLCIDAAVGNFTVVEIVQTGEGWPVGRVISAADKRGNDGNPPIRSEFVVTKNQLSQLRDEIVGSGFWNEPSQDDQVGSDGFEFMLEVKDGSKLRALTRFVPPRSDPVGKIASHLLDLAGITSLPGVF